MLANLLQILPMAVPLKSGALDGQYAGNHAFVIGNKIKDQIFEKANVTLRFPPIKKLGKLTRLSVLILMLAWRYIFYSTVNDTHLICFL